MFLIIDVTFNLHNPQKQEQGNLDEKGDGSVEKVHATGRLRQSKTRDGWGRTALINDYEDKNLPARLCVYGWVL